MPRRKNSRAPNGAGTINLRKDGRWEARYIAGRSPATGNYIRKSIYGKTQKEVFQKLQKINVEIEEGAYIEPSRMTVSEWLDVWVKEYTQNLKPRTLAMYKGYLNYRIIPGLGMAKLAKLTAPMIQKFYNDLVDDNLAPKTIRNIHGILHKALKQAVEVGYLRYNPADACKLPRIEKSQIKPLDDTAIAAFLSEIQGHPFERIYLIDLFTGMRQGEILGLTWDCIDFDKGSIHLYRQIQKVGPDYRFVSLKNNKTRTITPAPTVMSVLKDQRKAQAELKLKAGAVWSNTENFVFTNELGEHIKHQIVYWHYKNIVARIGLPAARFHDLRHSYAVASLRAGDDVKTIQENMGHHSAAFTLDQYGHVTQQMKKDSADRMEQFINRVKG